MAGLERLVQVSCQVEFLYSLSELLSCGLVLQDALVSQDPVSKDVDNEAVARDPHDSREHDPARSFE